MVRLAALAVTIAALLLAGCDMPSLGDLDLPEGDSTLTLLPSTINVLVGADATLTAKGGKAPYAFEADEGVITVVNATTVTFTPPAENTYIITVTDAAGAVCEATVMATATVPLSVSPASITIAAGTTVTLVASGGSGVYWFERITGGGTLTSTGFNSATYRTVHAENPARITLHSGSDSVDAILTFTEVTLTIIPAGVTLDANTKYTFTATGGTGGYWYEIRPGGVGTIVESTGEYTAPATMGSATIRVWDSGDRWAEAAVSVNSPPLDVTLSPANVHVGVGGSVTLTATGGTPPYTFVKLAGAGSISTTATTVTYAAPLVSETASIKVSDATTSSNATIYVDPPPALQISPATVTLTTNEGMAFTATGGTGGYQYAVVTGTGIINPSTGLFTAPAVEEIDTVRVTDSGGRTAEATVEIYFPLTIVPTEVFVAAGGTYAFSASGGKTDYTYQLTAGIGGSIGATTGLYTAPGSPGEETVRVLDALGNASYATVSVYEADWDIQSVDTILKSGQYASLALDPVNGYPRVAYYESLGKELRLASWNGAWSSEVVDSAGTVGQYCSLALDPSTGYARISYYDSTNRDLKYAAWNGSSWDLKVVDSSGTVGLYTSLALDPDTGYARISYYDSGNRDLKYASWNGSGWEKTIVDSTGDVGKYSSLALDPTKNDRPRIAYYDATSTKLKYAALGGGGWDLTNPDSATQRGQYCSLALDPTTGDPRISYYNSGAQKLWYAWYDGSSWDAEEVDGTLKDRGTYSSLALASSAGHHPRISYYDNTDKKLLFVYKSGSVWSTPITIDEALNVGSYSSLRLWNDGAVIAYYASSAQDLKVATE